MAEFLGSDFTRSRSFCCPASLEPAPMYSEPGMCACAYSVCGPTCEHQRFLLGGLQGLGEIRGRR